VGAGTWYPLGFTKEEVCALYWKNKSYNVSCTDVVDEGSTYESNTSGVSNYNFSFANSFAPTVETDFVCADVVSNFMVWAHDPDDGVYLSSFGYEFWNGVGFSLTTNCYFYNNQYFPLLIFLSPVGYTSVKSYAATVLGYSQSSVDAVSVSATCTFLGRNVPVYAQCQITVPLTVSGSMVITLNEQWPYDP
jgi:hypothetical protein